ncbi:MAG: exodeoxyribonuclease VII small subunit [Anaerolineae bacterium]|nr:exodeoxyribonuclease VII small subunit [Anaerolineae bacterium]
MKISAVPVEQMNYEQAFSELENIVEALEASQTSLEEAIALYERGQALANRCAELLEKAELRIRNLDENEENPLLARDS